MPILLDQLGRCERGRHASLALIRTLGQLGEKSAFKSGRRCYVKSKDAALRIEVLRALSNIDNRPARKIAENLLAR